MPQGCQFKFHGSEVDQSWTTSRWPTLWQKIMQKKKTWQKSNSK